MDWANAHVSKKNVRNRLTRNLNILTLPRKRRADRVSCRMASQYTGEFGSQQMKEEKTRRELVTAAASSLLLLKPQTVRGAQANSALSVGLIGCGRRGTYVSGLFTKNEFAKIAALCDIYDDQLAAATHKFSGARTFKNYHELLACDQEDVYIATPTYLHPEHFEAAV